MKGQPHPKLTVFTATLDNYTKRCWVVLQALLTFKTAKDFVRSDRPLYGLRHLTGSALAEGARLKKGRKAIRRMETTKGQGLYKLQCFTASYSVSLSCQA